MTSVEHGPRAETGADSADAPACDGLAVLIAQVPADLRHAALRVRGHLEQAHGEPVSIGHRQGDRWDIVVGAPLRDDSLTEESRIRVELAASTALAGAEIAVLTGWLELVAERDRHRLGHERQAEESDAQLSVAEEILAVRDLDQVLLSIVNRTLAMLSSDICGIFLREGEEIAMTACVGNRRVETAHLRMSSGQGLAGAVLGTGRIGRVDEYVDDRSISPDFVGLAELEGTRSALAVPLLLRGELIGVLEVWRRRASVFTEVDERRMVRLATLATIAIENARLYDLQADALSQLSSAHEELGRQVARLDRTGRLQGALLRIVLDHAAPFERIADAVAAEFDCSVVYARESGRPEAMSADLTAEQARALPLLRVRDRSRSHGVTRRSLPDGGTLWSHPVVVADAEIGSVNLIGEGEELGQIAPTVAMACALARLEQRAVEQARSAAFEQIVWDLVDGPAEHRRAALSRADELGLSLAGPHRIVHGAFENLLEVAREGEWDTAGQETARRAAVRAVRSTAGSSMRLLSLRGDWMIGILAEETAAPVRALMGEATRAVAEAVPGLRVVWGVSAAHRDPMVYPAAHREAVTALTGARRLSVGECSLYDELGIVRLLLGGTGQNADLQQFVDDVTGPLRDYDERQGGALVQTLRAYFDHDCSQRQAAEALFIHPKTLSYRLNQITELAGLDLSAHADRMRADLALRLLQLSVDD